MTLKAFIQKTSFGAFLILQILMNSCTSQVATKNSQDNEQMLDLFLKDVERIKNPDGFIVPCLDGSEKNKKDNQILDTKSLVPIYATGFIPQNCNLKDFDHYERLAGLPRSAWQVRSIVGYRTEKGYFQYTVFFTREGIAAITELTYLDVEGDGKFGIAFQSAGLKKPILPDWLVR